MSSKPAPAPVQDRHPYEKPAMRKLTKEQVRMRLLGAAMVGNKDAREMLEMFFYPDKE